MILLLLLTASLLGILIYTVKLRIAFNQASILPLTPDADRSHQDSSERPTIAVIIPAYNEAVNIVECVESVLKSDDRPASAFTVWVVDDQSTDNTWALLQALQARLGDDRLQLLAGQPRPIGSQWVGKNWACVQAAAMAKGDFLLFIDADVRLHPGAIATALQTAEQDGIDLLSCAPEIICGCLAEWLVQPLMINTILIGFSFTEVNDPQQERAFAAGPFMLFRRSAYEAIGGHRTVAAEIVEDVELAKRIKAAQYRLRYSLGVELATVRMYQRWSDLWEGWTKNLYIASHRNWPMLLTLAGSMLLIFTVPWLALISASWQFLQVWLQAKPAAASLLPASAIGLSLLILALHYEGRRLGAKISRIPPRYWWLAGLGGLAIAAITIGSIVKTETGWGWTWRGRSLAPAGTSKIDAGTH